MRENDLSYEAFEKLTFEHFAFLERHGFLRAPSLQYRGPVYWSIVYAANHVAILFNYEMREEYVVVEVFGLDHGDLNWKQRAGVQSLLKSEMLSNSDSASKETRTAEAKRRSQMLHTELLVEEYLQVKNLLQTAGAELLSDSAEPLRRYIEKKKMW